MNTDTLPAPAQKPVTELMTALTDNLGDNLLSLTLVGSVLAEDYSPKHSDINSVLVVKQITPETLDFLSHVGPQMGRRRLAAPLVMWPDYIRRSCDVFAVEWMDFQWRHRTLHGPDPFADLTFEKHHVRLACEREFKSALIRLRQGFVSSGGKPAVIAQLLSAAARELLPYLRAALWLHDIDRPDTSAQTFQRVEQICEVPLTELTQSYANRYTKVRITAESAKAAFQQAYKSVEVLADVIDKRED